MRLIAGVLVVASVTALGHEAAADVVINEIMYHPPSLSGDDEFLELYNTAGAAVDLNGWRLEGIGLTFGAGASIEGGGYLILARDSSAFLATYGFLPDHVYTTQLSNAGEQLQLFDDLSILRDEVAYDDTGLWPITPDGLGPSLELIDPSEDNNSARNWRASVDPASSTPRALNSVDAAGLPPWVTNVVHTVDPAPNTPIQVTAEIDGATTAVIKLAGGASGSSSGTPLVTAGDTWSYFKGTAEPSGGTTAWTTLAFDDSGWQSGPSGFGFGDGDDATNLNADAQPPIVMQGSYLSVYARREFTITDPLSVADLFLVMDYDDAYVAYINGVEVARSVNISGSPPAFNTPATSGHEASGGNTNPQGPDILDIGSAISLLQAGTNVLAVQGHNLAVDNVDFSLIPELEYVPTLLLLDDGLSGDGAAGDGVYGAVIDGQPENSLIRFRIETTGPNGTMSHPRTDDTVNYIGTVVADPALSTALPTLQWFMEDADYLAALDHRFTNETEPAILYYNGVLYDNIQARIRGGASRGWAKPNWRFELPQGHDFFHPELVDLPVDQLWMMSSYSDKSYLRQKLCYEALRDGGAPYSRTEFVRLHRNGSFFGLFTYVEAQDDDYVERNGLDPNASRYKTNDNNSAHCGAFPIGTLQTLYSKRQRLDEDYSDLFTFLDGINNLSGTAKRNFIFDNVDIPTTLNYLAILVVLHDSERSWHNYYLYRDTEGSQRWTMHAFDEDLTLGRNCCPVLNDDIYGNRDATGSHPLVNTAAWPDYFGPSIGWNRFTDAVLTQPDIQEMYFRRLRTLMDQLLVDGVWEARLTEIELLIATEAEMDRLVWPAWGSSQTLAIAIDIIENVYLSQRRQHLFVTHRVSGGIPEIQSPAPNIVINEIMYNPLSGPDAEFVELYNPSLDEAVDLSGWELEGVGLTIPAGTVILPDGYALFVRNSVQFRTTYGAGHYVPADYSGTLNNAGEVIRLLDDDDIVVDEVFYEPVAPWPVSADGGGPSLELIDYAEDNGTAGNWAASLVAGGTPGALNGVAVSGQPIPTAHINEVLPVNVSRNIDEQGEFEPWIELHNTGSATVNLGGMFLTDDFAVPDRWEFPEGTILCGGQWLLVWADAEPSDGPLHASFTLSPLGGSVGLYSASGVLVSSVNYPMLPPDVSYGSFPDGAALKGDFALPTPGASNVATGAGVFLNEYNAVRADRYLGADTFEGDDAEDIFFGRVQGNGGNWFELVVTEDHLDMRNWQLQWQEGLDSGTLMLSNDVLWSDLRRGTVVTFAEWTTAQGGLDTDVSYAPASGDWWIHVNSFDAQYLTTTTNVPGDGPGNFSVGNDDWQLTILNDIDVIQFGPAGEGIGVANGVSSREVLKLEEDPRATITPLANYNDGTSSTFGAANLWSAGTIVQDFTGVRAGVVQTCVSASECEDGNPCTDHACVAGNCEVTNNAVACNDANPCTSTDGCVDGVCTGTPVINCCIADCDCEDGNSCTLDTCVSNFCQQITLANGAICFDGDLCTFDDTCAGGICNGTAVDCSSLDGLCGAGACNSATGLCALVPANESATCDDGTACTVVDTCTSAGVCLGIDNCPAGQGCNPNSDQCESLPPATALPVVAGDAWLYFKGTVEPPAGWAGRFFDDSSWLSGPSGLGYGDSDDATVLLDMQGNYSTVYARRRFDIANPGAINLMTLTMDYDSGFVAYLNGYEVARSNVGGSPPAFDSVAGSEHEASAGDTGPNPPEDFFITEFGGVLQPGTNVLAIQGHNSDMNDEDFSLIATLSAVESAAAPVVQSVGSRYVAITPPSGLGSVALRVESAALPCLPLYVQLDGTLDTTPQFHSSFEWGTAFVSGQEIVPEEQYDVRADVRAPADPENLSSVESATTWQWADATNTDGVDIVDVVCALDGFLDVFTTCTLQGTDIRGSLDDVPDQNIDIADIVATLDAFSGTPFPGPDPCAGPAPRPPGGDLELADISLVVGAGHASPGDIVIVDAFIESEAALRAYQVTMAARVDKTPIKIVDAFVDDHRKDYLFVDESHYPLANPAAGRVGGALLTGGTRPSSRAYLGTFELHVPLTATGTLEVRLLQAGTLLVDVDGRVVDVGTTRPGVIRVLPERRGH